MSATTSQDYRDSGGYLHRMRHTPLRDLLRGRLSARLDVDRVIAEADLPRQLQEIVRSVTSHTRLWRIEKVGLTYYKIVNVQSGKALTVSDGSRRNNALMRQADYAGTDYQQFAFEQREGGVMVIVARHSGRSICVQVASRRDGAPIHQYDYVGVADQQIELSKVE